VSASAAVASAGTRSTNSLQDDRSSPRSKDEKADAMSFTLAAYSREQDAETEIVS
jgi:hypothetical protein